MRDIDKSPEDKNFKFLAYITLRDSVAFYFGIPEFLDEKNLKKVLYEITLDKIEQVKTKENRNLTPQEYDKCLTLAKRKLTSRIKELQEDFKNCEEVLFEDNLWLEILNLDTSFFKRYFQTLDDEAKRKLAVVPKFKTRDHSLGRSYINDNFLSNLKF